MAALLAIREDAPRVSRPDVVEAVFLRLDGPRTSHDTPVGDEAEGEQAAAAESTRPPVVEDTDAPEGTSAKTTRKPEDEPPEPSDAPTVADSRAEPAPQSAPVPEPRKPQAANAPPAEPNAASKAPPPTAERAAPKGGETPTAAAAEPTAQPAPQIAASTGTTPAAASGERPAPPIDRRAEEPAVETRPMRIQQREMIDKRFASLTRSFAADEPPESLSWKSKGQEYTAEFEREPVSDPMGTEHVVIEISTVENGTRLSTKLRMKRLAFSDFAQFVDRWDPDVYIHADEIDGRFHSNSEIGVSSARGAAPVFHGRVTTASREVRTDDHFPVRRRKMFPAGIKTGVRRILLPRRFVAFPDGTDVHDEQIERLERSARITFSADGTFVSQYLDDPRPGPPRALAEPAQYFLAADDAELRLSGVVHGKVLVYSPEKIVIEHDLVYATAPDADGADDYLGLVSERNVEIPKPDVTGPGDFEVDASIYARSRFVVRDYLSRPSGTLTVRGALVAGSISATEPRYATRVIFDRRLEQSRAPRFPLTDRYELETWSGTWAVEPTESDAENGPLNAFEAPN